MIKIAIILFRESLEIALLLGVILAFTKNVYNSRFYIILGIMIGILSASLLAFAIKFLTLTYFGLGGELFDVTVIFFTIALITWTVVWMQGYQVKFRRQIGDIAAEKNNVANFLLMMVVAVTIIREGAEIMLLLYSISTVDKIPIDDYLLGIGVGVFSGCLVGMLIYNGLIKFASRYIFKVSASLLILIAAGLASKAAAILTSSAIVEGYDDKLWDSSWLIRDGSNVGRFMNTMVGYTARPNQLQGLFYILTVVIIGLLMKWKSRQNFQRRLLQNLNKENDSAISNNIQQD